MQSRSAPLGTAVVGLAVALFLTTRPASPPAPGDETSAVPVPAPDSKAQCGSDSLQNYFTGAELIGRFFGSETSTPESALALARHRGYHISTLIATLPDPTDSRLDWGFDFDLDAIRRAHERTGLVVDRFWLPWGLRGSAKTPCAGERSLWARRPGVMLFRSAVRLHVLYLVGEIPTSGLHKAALREALDESAVLVAGSKSPTDTLRLVGPLFSGSTISLALLLKPWLDEASPSTRVSVVSGSATSLSNLTLLRDPKITFSATVNPDPALLDVLARIVACRLDLLPSKVALLSESSTSYGQQLDRTGARARGGACSAADSSREDVGYLRMTYPLSISSLRAEYQRHPEAQQPAAAPAMPVRPRVPLDLGDPSGLTESPPVMSQLTPAAVDLLLDGITRTLRDNDIRAVGVLGTDIRDKLFLSEEIRKRVHDVQLFTFSSNVLLSRTEYRNSLRGMLVLSTYPLLPENQRWTGGVHSENRRDLFPSDAAQGEYNATLVQLGFPGAVIEYRAPFDTSSTATRPPIWLTLIGRTVSLPLAVDRSPPYAPGYVNEVSPQSVSPSSDPSAVGGLVFLWTLAVGTAVLALAWHLIMRRSVSQREQWMEDDQDTTAKVATTLFGAYQGFHYLHGELYVLIVLFALVGVFLPTAALLLFARYEGLQMVPGTIGFLLGCLVLFAVSRRFRPARDIYQDYRADMGVYWARSRKWLSLTDLSAHAIALTLGFAYLSLVLYFVWSMGGLRGERFVFFFRRSVAVESGLSPLVPTLLIGVIITVWALWHRDRISLLQRFTEFESAALRRALSKESAGGSPDSAFTQASGRVYQIRESLFLLAPDRWAAALLVLTLALGGALWLQFDRTVESIALLKDSVWLPSAFDLLFRFGLLTGIGLTMWCLYRFVSIWRQFTAFLVVVRTMPIISAFDRLPQRVARVTRATLADAVREPAVDSMVEMQCSHLHRVYEHSALENDQESAPRRLAISRAMNELRDPIRTEGTDVPSQPQHGRQFVALYRALEECWATEPADAEVTKLAALVAEPNLTDEALKTSTTGRFRRMFGGRVGLWVRAAEELAACEVVEYIEWVLRHLRRLALVLLAILVLVTLLISSYPFQPHSTIKVIFFGLVLVTAITLVTALIQMNRDEVLSRITKTAPGVITWDTPFVLNVALFGIVPLLAILSAEFPTIRSVLFAWVEPLFRSLARG